MAIRTTGKTSGFLAWLTVGAVACASCSQKPSSSAPAPPPDALHAAFVAAFGKPAPWATLDDGGDRVVYTPQALLDVSPGVVALVSRETLPGGCRSCAGALTIHYLKRTPAGLARMGAWPRIGGMGTFGGVLPWTTRTDLDDGPTLVTRRDVHDRGCSATTEELITLTPTHPVKIATVVVSTAYDPVPGEKTAPHISGRIAPIVRSQSFVLNLSGSEHSRQVFKRQGEVFTTYDPGATGC